ncbi:MAG: LysM domain-containing protein [Planctomycetota bacterium]
MRKALGLAAALMLIAVVSAWGAEVRYTVREGDTLYEIARKYYGDAGAWQRIAAANGIRDRDAQRLQVGRVLLIPVDEVPPPAVDLRAPSPGPAVPAPAPSERPSLGAPPVAGVTGGGLPGQSQPPPPVEKLQSLVVEGNLIEVPEEAAPPRSLAHFHLGLATLVGLLVLQALCLHVAGRFVLERVTRIEILVAAAVTDAFLYFSPLFAWYCVAGLRLSPTGFPAAVVLLVVIGALVWAALWVASRVLSVSVWGALKLLVVGFMLFAVVLAALWGVVWGGGSLLRARG